MFNKWVKQQQLYTKNSALIIGNTDNITSPLRLVWCKKENGLNSSYLSMYFLYDKKGFPSL